ncbi:hypothetical protein ACTFIZ_011956 [Dictyostelium cf. discoideum]
MSIYSKYTIKDVLVNQESLQKKNKYTCQICFEYFYKKSIYQCKSGHIACQECWKKSLENKKECMICRREVKSLNNLSRCLVIEHDFGKKECYCIYSFTNDYFIDDSNEENEIKKSINFVQIKKLVKDEENGCKEIINLDQLDTHIENCKFKFVKCSNFGCDEIFRIYSMEEHENQCGFKFVKCEYCDCFSIQKELENHHKECPKFLIGCPQSCFVILERGQIESHIENDCNNTTIPCKYYEYGCKVEMKRPELQNHLNNVNHQYFMGLLIDKLSSTLSQSNKTQHELVKKIEGLENSSHIYKNKWIISDFSKVKSNKLTSESFNFGNQQFNILFYIGSNFGRYSLITLESYKIPDPFDYKYFCTLVNSNKSNSIKFKGGNNHFRKSDRSLLTHADINNEKNGWCLYDQLKIKVFIKKINNPLKSKTICQ